MPAPAPNTYVSRTAKQRIVPLSACQHIVVTITAQGIITRKSGKAIVLVTAMLRGKYLKLTDNFWSQAGNFAEVCLQFCTSVVGDAVGCNRQLLRLGINVEFRLTVGLGRQIIA